MSYSNLAMILQALGRYEEAREQMMRAIAIEEAHYEAQHPTLAVSYSNLAGILVQLREREEALSLWEKALEILLANFTPEHPHVQLVQGYLADYGEKPEE